MSNSSSAEFKIAYSGQALDSHEMDVSELGGALLSIGGLIQTANEALNGNATKVSVRVKAHEAGSFEIALVMEFLKDAESFLSGDFVTSVLNLKELLFGGTIGLFCIIKKTKGKKPERITPKGETVVLVYENNMTIEVHKNVYKLYNNKQVREYAKRVVSPVDKAGIDAFTVKDEKGDLIQVDKNEGDFFDVPEVVDNLLIDENIKGAYSIVSLAFKDDNKWRLSDGNSVLSVLIKDEGFLKKVKNDEISFAMNDVLVCEIHTKQWQTQQGLKTEYELLKVISHKSALKQMNLF